VSCKSDNIF